MREEHLAGSHVGGYYSDSANSVGDPEYILVFFNVSHLCVICFYFHYIFSASHWVFEKLSEKVYPFSSDIFSISFPFIHTV